MKPSYIKTSNLKGVNIADMVNTVVYNDLYGGVYLTTAYIQGISISIILARTAS